MSPTSFDHVLVNSRLMYALIAYRSTQKSVLTLVGEGGYVFGRGPDTVLVPDIVIVTKARIRGLK